MIFEPWDPSDIWSEWCVQLKRIQHTTQILWQFSCHVKWFPCNISRNWECLNRQHQLALLKTGPSLLFPPITMTCDSKHHSNQNEYLRLSRRKSGKCSAEPNDQELAVFTVEILTGMFWFKSGSFRFRKSWPACFGGDLRETDPDSVASDDWEVSPHCVYYHPLFPTSNLYYLHCSSLHLQFSSICYTMSIWGPAVTGGKPHGYNGYTLPLLHWPYSTRRASLDKHSTRSISRPIFTVILI